MIQGVFGEDNELFFEIELISADNLHLSINALLDTGFSDWLAIDKQDVNSLKWLYLEEQTRRTARGEVVFELYLGRINIEGQEFEVPVHIGEGLSEFLLGRRWLQTRRLIVNRLVGILTLES